MNDKNVINFSYLKRVQKAKEFLEGIFKDTDPQKASGKKLMMCTKIEGKTSDTEDWERYICGFCGGETGTTVRDDKMNCHTCGAVISKTGAIIYFPKYDLRLLWTADGEYIV